MVILIVIVVIVIIIIVIIRTTSVKASAVHSCALAVERDPRPSAPAGVDLGPLLATSSATRALCSLCVRPAFTSSSK